VEAGEAAASYEIHVRSFPASFRLPSSCNSFTLAMQEVISLGPARYPARFPKKDRDWWKGQWIRRRIEVVTSSQQGGRSPVIGELLDIR
jgi:hypothetical protein